jgi:F-type H+-transporting ATPase subunit delta
MTQISKEYAVALFMLACEKKKREEYDAALKTLHDAFSENPEYLVFLSSRGIPLSERLDAIEQAFSKQLPEDVVSFLKLLCEKGRVNCFSDAVQEYQNLLNASKRVSNAKVISAVALSDEEKEKLGQKLKAISNTTVKMEYVVDASLLGGVIVEIDGKVLDGSIKNRLRDIKEVMNG